MGEPSLELTPQTAALAGASDALESAGLEHWFFGGWAVDLWVGRVTRAHDDIDVLVRRTDDEGRVVVPVPGQPIVVSTGPLDHAHRPLGHLRVRVLTLEKMLEGKGVPRPDDAGGAKDRADLAALRAVDATR